MIILEILKFASSNIVNFLITTFYLTLIVHAISSVRLIEVTYMDDNGHDE